MRPLKVRTTKVMRTTTTEAIRAKCAPGIRKT